MSKQYTITSRLWDVTDGERTGDLLEESEPFQISPLSKVLEWFDEHAAQAPVRLDPISLRAVRVALSRSGGRVAMVRRRFDHEGRRYLVTVQIDGPPTSWQGVLADGRAIEVVETDAAPLVTVGGEAVDLAPLRA